MKKKFFIILFCIVFIAFLAYAFVVYKIKSQKFGGLSELGSQNLSAPIEIPDTGIKKYNDVTDIEKPMVILFYVDWCAYCRRFMPIYGEISKNYSDKYNFAIVNCEDTELRKIVEDYHIMGFPSVFILDKKYDYKTQIDSYSTSDKDAFSKELDSYYNLRKRIK